jgi:hypothetical protein
MMKRDIRGALAAFAFAVLFSGFAGAQVQGGIEASRMWKLCPNEVFELPQEIFEEWVPVGCETVDCCPGCPGVLDKLQWRIRVEGAPLEAVGLKFARLPKDIAAGLEAGGAAVGDGETFTVKNGEGTIDGLPIAIQGRAPVAQISVKVNAAWMQDQAKKGEGGATADAGEADSGDIIVEQWLGKVRVNEFKLAYRFPRCPGFLSDKIVLLGNDGGDAASVLMDARRSTGCVLEEERRGAGTIGLGSVLANSGCRSEVAVFSDDDAMKLVENVTAWTNLLGDTLNVKLSPNRLMAPVSAWIARPSSLGIAGGDLDNANLLYNSNNAGIGFASTITDVSSNAAAVSIINNSDGCVNLAALQASGFFTPGRLNVYYIDRAFTGFNCNANRNIQYVGTTANNQTLAHEFGHAMSLGHTNSTPGFPVNNVMVGGGSARTHFSDGQSFRLNTHCSSTLNANGTRSGPLRNCGSTISGNVACPVGTSTHCPPLETDVTPN